MAHITKTITLEQVIAARPRTIYYGANTCWWTHTPDHLYRHPEAGLPCDPRGGMLFQTDNVSGFLREAQENPHHYGRHGLDAFMAAHHLNCQVSRENSKPTCMRSWEEYNDAIDESTEGRK